MKSFRIAVLSILCAVILAAPVIAAAAVVVPNPTTDFYVNDFAGKLSASTKQTIMTDSVALQKLSGAQIVVTTVDSLNGAVLTDYSLQMLRSWGIGDKTKDNGILILVSVNDRQVRIEVGYGLEGRINDAKAGRILDSYVTPYLTKGDYDSGILNGYLAILQEVAAEYNLAANFTDQASPVAATTTKSSSVSSDIFSNPIFWIVIVVLFLFDWIVLHGSITRTLFWIIFAFGRGGRGGGFGGGGGGFGGGGGSGGGGGASRGF